MSISPGPLRIYLASPVGTFGTVRYQRQLAAARRHFPDAAIVEPCHLFLDTADWRRHWDYLITTLDVVVFFTSPAGGIGFGVYKEMVDARRAGLLVYWLNEAGRLVPDTAFDLAPLVPGNPYAVASVAAKPSSGCGSEKARAAEEV